MNFILEDSEKGGLNDRYGIVCTLQMSLFPFFFGYNILHNIFVRESHTSSNSSKEPGQKRSKLSKRHDFVKTSLKGRSNVSRSPGTVSLLSLFLLHSHTLSVLSR